MSGEVYDVAVVGGGPAGAVCAAACAEQGLRTVVLERAKFPREKVCGDCLNPNAWPVLERLALADRVLQEAHARLQRVEFIDTRDRGIAYPLEHTGRGLIAIRRSLLDQLLLRRARELGAEVLQETPVTHCRRAAEEWQLETPNAVIRCRDLVAADGRNSSIARAFGLLAKPRPDRIGQQTHIPLPGGLPKTVRMQFVPRGYCGVADVGNGLANLCLVAKPGDMPSLKEWAARRYGVPADQDWRSIAPLSRRAAAPVRERLWLVGDAARVVEPFTGEGISYAMRTGLLAAEAIVAQNPGLYREGHRKIYRSTLWINELAKAACISPAFADILLAAGRAFPRALCLLTRKVAG